jgi:outer membrane murein-binding lipoprotein Lpp
MAKPPSKRRGITLGPRADGAAALERLHARTTSSLSPTSHQNGPDAEAAGNEQAAAPTALLQQLDQLRIRDADRDIRWQRQVEQLQDQLRQLEEQREQIALQARQLQVLAQTRQSSGRLGALLALLSVAGVAALGFHTWPRLQDVAGDVSRLNAGVSQLAPQLQAVRGEVSALTGDMHQMGGVLASLRQDVSGVRSDLGSLRPTVDTAPVKKGPAQANAGAKRNADHPLPRNATTMSGPYWAMRPRMPW